MIMRHGAEHVHEFVLILRLHVHESGNVAEVADVEESVVRRAVVAGQAAAVHAQRDVQILQRHVMNDHVVGALHEGRVNREERLETLRRQASGEQRGVLLGDADIEVPVRVRFREMRQPRAARHRAGDGDRSCCSLSAKFASVLPKSSQ